VGGGAEAPAAVTPGHGLDAEILVPAEPLAAADALRAKGESFADLVLSALEDEIRRRRGPRTYDALLRMRSARAAGRTAPRATGAGTPGRSGFQPR